MGVLYNSFDTQVAEYNFAESGGAIGTYRLGLNIDRFSLISFIIFQPKIAFASGGLATISFGYIDENGGAFPAALVAATAFGGPFLPTSPSFSLNPAIEITMSIAVAPVTAGRIQVLTSYFNTDL